MKLEIAIIMRSDEVIKKFNLKRITVNTSFGPVHRCYIGKIYNVPVLVIYGRFNGEKVPSSQINFEQTIEVVKNMNIDKLIGTFVVGGINPKRPKGSVYVLGDFVSMGNYNIYWNKTIPFRNAEMYEPFCPTLTNMLNSASTKMPFEVIKDAIYVSFTGWPRIETKAELDFYNKMGWEVVGQTCDPEATVARLNSICYGAVAVQIDDPISRGEYVEGLKENEKKPLYTESIRSCRSRTTKLVLQFLREYKDFDCTVCKNMKRENKDFREFPDYFYE